MADLGRFASILGKAALGGAGPSGRTALAGIVNQERRIASREQELASTNRRASDMVMLGAIREAKGTSQWATIPQQDRDQLDMVAQDLETRNNVQGFTSIPTQQAEAQETFEPVLDKDGNVVAQRSTTTKKVVADPRAPKAPLVQVINEAEQTLSDVGIEDKVTRRRLFKDKQRIDRQLAKAQQAFDAFKKAPGSGGITGALAENIGGLLGQLPVVGGTIEDGINVALTGGTAEENTRARTNAITLASDLLSEITGEESGRFTEAERELAFRALRQLKAASSSTQIAEAYRVFIEVSVNSKDRLLNDAGEPRRFDTTTKDGAKDFANNLMERGFSQEQAVDALKRRIRTRSLSGG